MYEVLKQEDLFRMNISTPSERLDHHLSSKEEAVDRNPHV
jgi:hypothetical protein